MGVFIDIQVQSDQLNADTAAEIVRLCPVEIFVMQDGKLTVDTDQVDECTLCELCLQAAPPDAIAITKHFSGETLYSGRQTND